MEGITVDRKCVLFADNDRAFLDGRSEFLDEDYQVFKAYNPGEVERLLEQENIHLAILDLRLVNDNDERDNSGILLAKDEQFRRIPKIILTGFPTYEAVLEAVGPIIGSEPIVLAFLAKKEGPNALIEKVKSAFENVVRINWKLQVVWDEMGLLSFPYLVLLLENSLDLALLTARSDELRDLFRKLFFKEEQISIFRLNWLRDGCACLSIFASSEGSLQQSIVVFGNWGAIDDQRKLEKEYLVRESGILPQPNFAETLRYAGLVYTIPETGVAPLQNGISFFQEAGDKNVRTALENLYRQTLHNWHQHERSEIRKTDLAAIYRDRLAILVMPEAIEEGQRKILAMAENARSYSLMKEISLEGGEIKFVFTNGYIIRGPDPIAALFDPHTFKKQLAVIGSTFGGIASNSLLIDEEGNVFPTDMSSITRSPIQEDFVSIECEFHFDKINSFNLLSLLDFEKQLGELKTLNDLLPTGNVEPECRKSMTAIQAVRKLAAEMTSDALEPYLIGLFHYTIRTLLHNNARIYPAKHQVAQFTHRLMAASLILAQIKRLSGGEEKTKVDSSEETGVKINEASREVIVDGREVQLTQTEFKLLLHLYKKPNHLCSREEILSEVFEIKRSPLKSDKGLLNSHMDRLRKKIDLNPTRHRYIVTIRGEGYRLNLKP